MPDDMTEELYRIIGPAGQEYHRARQCVRDTLAEALVLDAPDPDRVAEAILARLVALDPPILTVSLVAVEPENE